MSIYLDTSGLVKTLLSETGSSQLLEELSRHNLLITARTTYAETCAALARAQQMGRVTAAERDACLQRLDVKWPDLQRVAIDEQLVTHAGALAVRLGLRGYDAIQLAAADVIRRIEPLSFVAWDRELRGAAAALGFPLFPSEV